MSFDPQSIAAAVARHGPIVRVLVAEVSGSAPREAGASMLVWKNGQSGTIGGGTLEHKATTQARETLELGGGAVSSVRRVPLGPDLGQCCGGAVTLVSEVLDSATLARIMNPRQPGYVLRKVGQGADQQPLALRRMLGAIRNGSIVTKTRLIDGWLLEPVQTAIHQLWLFGAGHVGRAIVDVLAPVPDWQITWIDTSRDRFPSNPADSVDCLVAANPVDSVRHAPADAHHLVLSYSHALDLELCHSLLEHGFSSAGLIGSATKWARFRKRLRDLGHSDASISRIDCPIGTPALGKHPQAIAISTTASLLQRTTATSGSAMERPA